MASHLPIHRPWQVMHHVDAARHPSGVQTRDHEPPKVRFAYRRSIAENDKRMDVFLAFLDRGYSDDRYIRYRLKTLDGTLEDLTKYRATASRYACT